MYLTKHLRVIRYPWYFHYALASVLRCSHLNRALDMLRLISVTLIFLIGCVPKPHEEWTRPQINGVVQQNGSPVVDGGIYVGYSQTKDCSKLMEAATTNTEGSFEVLANKQRKFWYDIINGENVGQLITICIKTSDQYFYGGEFLFKKFSKPHFKLICDISQNARERGNQLASVCRESHV